MPGNLAFLLLFIFLMSAPRPADVEGLSTGHQRWKVVTPKHDSGFGLAACVGGGGGGEGGREGQQLLRIHALLQCGWEFKGEGEGASIA